MIERKSDRSEMLSKVFSDRNLLKCALFASVPIMLMLPKLVIRLVKPNNEKQRPMYDATKYRTSEVEAEADQRLHDSGEDHYRSFIDSVNQMIFLKDSNLKYLFVNKEYCDYFDRSESDFIGKTNYELLTKEEAFAQSRLDLEVMAGRVTETSIKKKDGSVCEIKRFPVVLHDGTTGVGAISNDITKRRQAETALKRERDSAQMYLDLAFFIFVVLDEKGCVTQINREGCQTLGYKKDQIIGNNWIDCYVLKADKIAAINMIDDIRSGRKDADTHYEYRILTATGEERVIVWQNIRRLNESGKIELLVSGVDVTVLKNTLDCLTESERSKSVLLANLPGVAFRCLQDEEFTMQFISEGCYDLTGYMPAAFIGNKTVAFKDIICDEYKDRLRQKCTITLKQKAPLRHEYEIMTASGERKWVLQTSRGVYDNNGYVEAIEGIIIDITESKYQFLQLQYLSEHDALTGLYNRQHYNEARSKVDRADMLPLGILVADINGLKHINDTCGNNAGDTVIRKRDIFWESCCRPGDILARTGGDEFSVLLPNTTEREVLCIIDEIRAAVAAHNALTADSPFSLNISLGHSVKESVEISIFEIEKEAAANMSRHKLLEQSSQHSTLLAAIMATMYERSFETEAHAMRLAQLTKPIAEKLRLPQREVDKMNLFTRLHDIGKIGVHDSILNKPGPLIADEWSQMKKHPEIGYRIAMSSIEFADLAEYILTHHEKWDGTGYPRGLKGEEIPLLSRILAVADAYDAMVEDRIYRTGMSHEAAIEEIRKNSGTQFDPAIVNIFLEQNLSMTRTENVV